MYVTSIYIYIYIYRERERDVSIYIYIYRERERDCLLPRSARWTSAWAAAATTSAAPGGSRPE